MTSAPAVNIASSITSINDIRDRYYRGDKLKNEELLALYNYERYRLYCLNLEVDERSFHHRYLQLQVMANLSPYQEFLKEEYSLIQ